MTEQRLAIASYNIHACVGTDGRYAPDRVADVIRELDADIVALQEVDRRHRPDRPHFRLEQLGEAAGYHAIACPVILHDAGGDYGNGLLSRWPVPELRCLNLSVDRCEPRGAIDADIDVGGRRIRIISTHLGLKPWERRIQATRLLAALAERGGGPLLVVGDFNEWHPFSISLRMLQQRLGRVASPRTFPSYRPLLPLDRIWALPAGAAAAVRAHASRLARLASDHLPVRAEVVWARDGGRAGG